jgi:hypothetical protein
MLIVLACWYGNSTAFSQETLEQKRERADAFFDEKNWSAAEALYASIITDAATNHDLNFRYGTCLLFGSKNKEEAIKRLRFSLTGPGIDKRAYYYLGRAYHLNYQFNEAIKNYQKFKELNTKNEFTDINVDTDLKACNFGKKLLSDITNLIVIQKTELRDDNFYDLYKLDDIGGTILVTDQFQSKLDQKKNHRPIIHFPTNSPFIYYSSYGVDGSTGLDIYLKKKLPGGEWSEAQKVSGQVNTELDENFAYMHPSGEYLYFCSKGHNSMGGYDVFRSKYDKESQSFGPPDNLDFAISSPDDDLLFVVDSLDKVAYFASSRESEQGKLTVYKVRVDRVPMQMAVIKGNFLNTVNDNQKEVEIVVEDFSNGQSIGTYNSKQTNGDYLITFPKSGKYNLKITVKGSEKVHNYIVNLPASREFKPLKQSMTLELDGNSAEIIVVKDLFSEDFDDPSAIMAEVYRELSKLDPNVQDFNIDSLDAIRLDKNVFVEAGLDPFITKEGLSSLLEDQLSDLNQAKTAIENQLNIAYNVAVEKSDLANSKMVELNKELKEAENAVDPKEKNALLLEISKEKQIIEQLNNEAQSLIELTETIEKSLQETQETINETANIKLEVDQINSNDRNALASIVEKNETFLKENVTTDPNKTNPVDQAFENGIKEQKDIQNLSLQITDLSKQKRELEAKNTQFEKDISQLKKEKDIALIQSKIDQNISEIEVLSKTIDTKSKQLNTLIASNETVRNGVAAEIVLKDDYNTAEYKSDLTNQEKASIESKVKDNDLNANLALVDEVLEENNVSAFNIDLYANDEVTSNFTKEDWNDAIDKETQLLNEEKSLASKERQAQIQAEIDKLEELRNEKTGAKDLTSEVDVTTISPEIKMEEVLPDYTKKSNQIQQIVSEVDRRKAINELNKELLVALETEKRRLEELIAQEPKAKNLVTRLENLEKLQTSLVEQNKSNEEWIALNSENKTYTKEDVIASLDPLYTDKIREADQIADPDERTKEITSINENILERGNERIQELQAILSDDPDNEAAKAELEYMETFVDDVKFSKTESLVPINTIDVENLSTTVLPSDVVKNYEERQTKIQSIQNENERRKQENILNQELINAAKKEKIELEKLLVENPKNKNISKRIETLTTLEKTYQKIIDENEDWLANNASNTSVALDENLIKDLNPQYQAEINRIDGLEDPKDKTEAIEKLNATTLNKINDRIDELDQVLEQDPANEDAFQEKKSLNELTKIIEKNQDTPLLTPLELAAVDVNPTEKEIFTSYENELAEIESSNKSTVQKEKDKIALNQELLIKIENELKAANEQKRITPDGLEQLNEREANLIVLKEKIEGEIRQSEQIIDGATASTDLAPATIESLMPDFEKDLAEIKNSDKSSKDKLTEENQLNKTLLSAIEGKTTLLENELKENPEMSATITKEMMELGKLKEAIEAKISDLTNQIAADNSAETASRPMISVGALMPDYQSKITDIRNASGTDIEKMQRENELSLNLIKLVDQKIVALKQEKSQNPELATVIDQEIAKLEDIKRSTQNSIAINKDQISQLQAANPNRPEITIGSLMSDFESKIIAIDQSLADEVDKLARKNELNEKLIRAIEAKIEAVQEDWEEDTNNGALYSQEIGKLEELKESKLNEIAKNNEKLTSLQAGNIEVASLNTLDFKTEEGKEVLVEFERELSEIKEIDAEINRAKEELNASDDPKDNQKTQKQLGNLIATKTEIENKVIEGLAQANKAELSVAKNNLLDDKALTQNSAVLDNMGLTDLRTKAEDNLKLADQKMKQANTLRTEAANEKDPLVANEKLKKAFQLEKEAIALMDEAGLIYEALRVSAVYDNTSEVVLSVPENVSERQSTALMDEADALRAEARTNFERANVLRDSIATVKKKNQAAILEEVAKFEAKGNDLQTQANEIEERAAIVKAEEDLVQANSIGDVKTQVDGATAEKVAASEVYKNYIQVKNEGDKFYLDALVVDEQIEKLELSRNNRIKIILDKNPGEDPTSLINDDDELAELQAEIDSLKAVQRKLRDQALAKYAVAKEILDQQDEATQAHIKLMEQEDVKYYVKAPLANVDFEIPDVIETDIFRTTDVAVYSEEARIPVSAKQPNGLVYKVQVGAFRNPLRQDHFKDFAPISGELLNNGITRYMVGYFTKFDAANNAKTQVNGIGYADAFVVAYCNGERITVDRAKQTEAGLITCDGTTIQSQQDLLTINNNNNTNNTNNSSNTNNTNNTNTANNTNNTNTANNTNNTNATATIEDQSSRLNIRPTTEQERQLAFYYTSVPNAARANQVEIIKGLFFTVQIGVYSKPVPNSALFNIQPLNSQRTESGFVRYSTGIFVSGADATKRKNEVVQKGVTDAFVTAYFNGERITIEQAKTILAREGNSVLLGQPLVETVNVTEVDTVEVENPDENPTEKAGPIYFKEALYYRLLIGVYDEAIPGEYAILILQEEEMFEAEVGEDGRTILFTNKIESYDEMTERIIELSDLGIENLDLLTYYKYDIIPFEEGEKIRKGESIDELHPYQEIQGIGTNEFVYNKEAVFFKIKLGLFEDKIPSDFTNLLLLYEEEENISKEETIDDEIIFYTGSIETFEAAELKTNELISKGFDRAVIVAYHKFDEISIEKAREILGE